MKKLFLTILNLLSADLNITEAMMYKSGDFSRIDFETNDLMPCKYYITITKVDTDGNS